MGRSRQTRLRTRSLFTLACSGGNDVLPGSEFRGVSGSPAKRLLAVLFLFAELIFGYLFELGGTIAFLTYTTIIGIWAAPMAEGA